MDDLVVRMHVTERGRGDALRPVGLLARTPARVGRLGRRRRADDRGEGVISAAIAVLIMAFLGVGVWLGFRATLDDTQEKVDSQVEEIGR